MRTHVPAITPVAQASPPKGPQPEAFQPADRPWTLDPGLSYTPSPSVGTAQARTSQERGSGERR